MVLGLPASISARLASEQSLEERVLPHRVFNSKVVRPSGDCAKALIIR